MMTAQADPAAVAAEPREEVSFMNEERIERLLELASTVDALRGYL